MIWNHIVDEYFHFANLLYSIVKINYQAKCLGKNPQKGSIFFDPDFINKKMESRNANRTKRKQRFLLKFQENINVNEYVHQYFEHIDS